ncbi:MAG: spermidine/putrescine ABC transporter substrate-binding protein [Solirubrobacterales bacterium]|nr:spermidine/putrescine ABC transporter substrate-binding protein [Solirubrobacterales bacterium]MCB8970763.1 spermidine/putrescine ABC transporter substrate-binding protein [Thermoleophilales bacterium]
MSSWDLGRTLTRRQALRAGAGGALGLAGLGSLGALSGCTVERALDLPEAGVNVKPKIDGDLLIYNWAQYMNPAIKKAFTEKYGVEVNEVNFDNLEAMVTKLRAGGQYDIIWPTPEYAFRLNQEGLLAHFDRDDLKNAKGISSFYDNGWWDPESKLSVPYTYYTTGIAWRDDEVQGMTGSWNDLTNPDGEGRMFILDDFQEAIGEANLINGFDLNTTDPNELEISKETLLAQKEFARGISTNSTQNLVNGTAAIHQAWNGDIVNVRNQVDNPEVFKYETCSEGVPVGTDLMCIPATARSPGTALKFIDWILEPDNAAQNVAWNGYPQPVEGGRQEFAKLVKEEPSIDVNLEQLGDGGMEYRLDNPEDRRLWNQTWTEVKAS